MDYNDNQNPNHWTGRGYPLQDTSGSPYYNQPLHSPYAQEKFAIAAIVCGVLAMVCNCVFIFPIMFASLGFIFVALSHRKGKKHSVMLRNGIILSAFGMFIGIASGIIFFTSILPKALQNPLYQEQIEIILEDYQNLFESMYGNTQ